MIGKTSVPENPVDKNETPSADIHSRCLEVGTSSQIDCFYHVPSDEELANWDSFGRYLEKVLQFDSIAHVSKSCVHAIGRFPILGRLGRGGSGTVYHGIDPILGRSVAIKVLNQCMFSRIGAMDRFLQEGKILSELSHSNIVAIHEVGFDEDFPFLVFEFCSDGSLADWLSKQSGYISPESCGRIVLALSMATHFAHSHGVVHRDINPRNVLLVPLPEEEVLPKAQEFPFLAKLSDFGLGTWLDDNKSAVKTETGAIMGTLPYMAPEQTKASTQILETKIDVYAMGVMLYELLTRHRPFEGRTQLEVLRLIHEAEPTPPRKYRTPIPRDLETICLKCLEKSPARRYTSAELVDDLDRFVAGNPIRSRRLGIIEKSARWLRKYRFHFGIGSMLVILLIMMWLGGWWYSRQLSASRSVAYKYQQKSSEQSREVRLAIITKNELELKQMELKQQLAEDSQRARHTEYINQIEVIGRFNKANSYDLIQRLRQWIPRSQAEADNRGFEWYYLMQACGGDIAIITSPGEPIASMHVADQGDFAYLAHGKNLTEWNLRTGERQRLVATFSDQIRDFAVSHRIGRIAVALNDVDHIEVLDLNSKTPLEHVTIKGRGKNQCNRISISQDCRYIITINNNEPFISEPSHVLRFDFSNNRRLHPTFQWSKRRVSDAVFDPSNATFVIALDGSVLVVNGDGKKVQNEIKLAINTELQSMSLTDDNKLLAVSTIENEINLLTKNLQGEWKLRNKLPVNNYSPTGRNQVDKHNLRPVRFRDDGQRLYSGSLLEVFLWDVPQSLCLSSVHSLPGIEIQNLDLLTDERTVVWATDKAMGLWRPIEGIPAIDGHEKETWSVAFSPDDRLLATGSDDEKVRLWSLSTGDKVCEFAGHDATVSNVAFSPQGDKLASGSLDGTVNVWDIQTRQLISSLTGQIERIQAMEWFADGQRLVVSDSKIRQKGALQALVWNVSTRELLQLTEEVGVRPKAIVVTSDQSHVILCDEKVHIWNPVKGVIKQLWDNHSPIRDAILLNRGRELATCSKDGLIRIREMNTGNVIREFLGHVGEVLTIAVSPDGKRLVSGGIDQTVRVWDIETTRCLLVFDEQPPHGKKEIINQINSVAFSIDGSILAYGTHDGSVKLRYGPKFHPLQINYTR